MAATISQQSKQGTVNPNFSQGIGYSPVSPASSGIPSLRSLRSFLPFGPNKNATLVSRSVSPNSSRSPFAGFGSVRRSMTKECERKVSLSNDAVTPVFAIEKSNNNPFPDDTAVRRSVSLSTFDKPLPTEPSFEGSISPFRDHLLPSAFTLRTPSPGPSLSAELSTIIEADNSGVSKHIATDNSSPIHSSSPTAPKVSPSTIVNGNSHTAPKPSSSPALPSTSTPATARRSITLNHTTKSFNPSTPSSSLSTSRAAKVFGKQPLTNGSTSNLETRTLQQVALGIRTSQAGTHDSALPSIVTLGRTSLDPRCVLPTENGAIGLGRPSLEMSRRTSFDFCTRPALNRSSTSPERIETTEPDSSPSPDIPFQEYRPSLDSITTTRPLDTISQPNSTPPLRDWDGQRMTPPLRMVDTTITRDKLSPVPRIPTPQARIRKRSMSVQERFGRGRIPGNEVGAGLARSGSSLSAYAGRGGSGVTGRRGSESFSAYGSTSSYGGSSGGGRGSSYGHNGLMESPTFTVSSGSRESDTLRSSVSTTATSLADSFGYFGRDRSERDLNRERERDQEREEMREMKERHGTEMGALLGALSDSQRTARVLREENSDLRDRLERLRLAVQANQELRQMCSNLQSEFNNLRRENTDLRRELVGLRATKSRSGLKSSGLRTPVPKSSPLAQIFTPRVSQEEEEEYDETFIDHGSEVENYPSNKEHGAGSSENILPSSSSQKRRLSNSSSIFPIPPSNMTLLLHEDATFTLGSGNESTTDHGSSLPPPATTTSSNPSSSSSSSQRKKTHARSLSQSPPISYQSFVANVPNTSTGSISPTTANFSMVTGSPGSLFLRPEHEILLGDMESLDLGVLQSDNGEVTDGKVDGW